VAIEKRVDWKGVRFSLAIALGSTVLAALPAAWHYAATSQQMPLTLATPLLPEPSTFPLSTSTPERTINALSIAQAVPAQGKFIAADLVNMQVTLYQDGVATATYPILTKGRPGTPYETPAGQYTILSKEADHINGWEHVHMPYSMEFYGNYFIHGWPTYADGTPVPNTYSGGCIRLATDDAAQVYAFAKRGTPVFVYDTGAATSSAVLALAPAPLPELTAGAYLVADLDTGDVYAEHDSLTQRPIASVTKLMTALVANETIMFDRPVTIKRGELSDIAVATDTAPETFVVGDLLYPLLMESNNTIADTLAAYYGTRSFVAWMNSQAKALDMSSTTFADPSGISPKDISTPEDLYRLAVYLANKKSFVWKITRTPQKTITADTGDSFVINNFNEFSSLPSFIGGKVGHTTPAQDTMVSVFSMPIDGVKRRVAVIVLDSANYTDDTKKLADWFTQSASLGSTEACASCALPHYHRISL
jgi:D-alanyl-D-alanine carboxypeptidase/lipoprotein-anchoring transpeptidase ErfK/SrfK